LLMGGFEKAYDSKILLHNIDAVFTIFDHLDDLIDVAAGLFKVNLGLYLILVHKILVNANTYTYGVGSSIISNPKNIVNSKKNSASKMDNCAYTKEYVNMI